MPTLHAAQTEFDAANAELRKPDQNANHIEKAQRRFASACADLVVSGLEELTKAAQAYLQAEREAGVRAEALNASMAESTKISARASETSANASASMAFFTKVIAVVAGLGLLAQVGAIVVQAKTKPPVVNYTAPTINNVMPDIKIPPAQIIVQQSPPPAARPHRARPAAPKPQP